jgi:GT2 family glycosyltransferase
LGIDHTIEAQLRPAPAANVNPLAVRSAIWRVRVVIPALGRAPEVSALLEDLAREADEGQGRFALSVLVVDNASDPTLEEAVIPPEALDVAFLRLDRNRGGAGGFNAGLDYWLRRGIGGDSCELLWLLDSDVRLAGDALGPLLEALDRDASLGIVGSALVSPVGGEVFELGGRVDPRTGEYRQDLPRGWEDSPLVPAEYIAACSLLIRRSVAERAGLMADIFLNGDDVEWVYRASRVAGCGVGIATASRVVHPRPDRPRTIARYYAARNAFRAIDEAAHPTPSRTGFDAPRARWARALRETARALAMTMIGRGDLGDLHIRGLEDAAAGLESGPGSGLHIEPAADLAGLPDALRPAIAGGRGKVLVRPGVLPEPAPVMRSLNALCVEPVVRDDEPPGWIPGALRTMRRLVVGPDFGVAIVPGRGYPQDWLIARVMVSIADGKFIVRRWGRAEMARELASRAQRGLSAARRLRRRRIRDGAPEALRAGPTPTVSVVVLSYNRWERLRETLRALRRDPALRTAQVIVADNASTDGTIDHLSAEFPHVELLAQRENVGIAAFNQGARRATGDTVLILDDDAWPAPGVLERALGVLARRHDIAAVALHPRHPESGASEWPFAQRSGGPHDRWPVMGCANLVRREIWERIGGYEEFFFLYRNDTDLALKLLGAGHGVWFDPELVALHDSPAAARKSARWCRLATRNWVWVCRRHGRGASKLAGVVAGWLWAHRLAGASPSRHWAVLKGALEGLSRRAPAIPERCAGADTLRELLKLRFRRR